MFLYMHMNDHFHNSLDGEPIYDDYFFIWFSQK